MITVDCYLRRFNLLFLELNVKCYSPFHRSLIRRPVFVVRLAIFTWLLSFKAVAQTDIWSRAVMHLALSLFETVLSYWPLSAREWKKWLLPFLNKEAAFLRNFNDPSFPLKTIMQHTQQAWQEKLIFVSFQKFVQILCLAEIPYWKKGTSSWYILNWSSECILTAVKQ